MIVTYACGLVCAAEMAAEKKKPALPLPIMRMSQDGGDMMTIWRSSR